MNSLYSLGLRQISSIQNELNELEKSINSLASNNPSNHAVLHGQIAATLSSLQHTLNDYEAMSRAEVVDSKRVKAEARIEKFRDDYSSLIKHFNQIKTQERNLKEQNQRQELLQGSSSTNFRTNISLNSDQTEESPYSNRLHRTNASSNNTNQGSSYRTNAALNEHQFLHQTNNTLDIYIAQGQAILGNLSDQRDILKGTQKKLRSAANVLGFSRETIQFIERRSKGDFIVFIMGVFFTFISFYCILKFFG